VKQIYFADQRRSCGGIDVGVEATSLSETNSFTFYGRHIARFHFPKGNLVLVHTYWQRIPVAGLVVLVQLVMTECTAGGIGN